jgi:hypothetical protein
LFEILLSLLFIFLYLLLKILLEPYWKMRSIWNQNRKDFVLLYRPVLGSIQLIKDSLEQHDSVVHFVYQMTQENPDLRLYLTNLLNMAIVHLVCPKMVKAFVNN